MAAQIQATSTDIISDPMQHHTVQLQFLRMYLSCQETLEEQLKIAGQYIRVLDLSKTYPIEIFKIDIEILDKLRIERKTLLEASAQYTKRHPYSNQVCTNDGITELLEQFRGKPQRNPAQDQLGSEHFIVNNYLGDLNKYFKKIRDKHFRILFAQRKEKQFPDILFSTQLENHKDHRDTTRPIVRQPKNPDCAEPDFTDTWLATYIRTYSRNIKDNQALPDSVVFALPKILEIEAALKNLILAEVHQSDLPESAKVYLRDRADKQIFASPNKFLAYCDFLYDTLQQDISMDHKTKDYRFPWVLISLWEEMGGEAAKKELSSKPQASHQAPASERKDRAEGQQLVQSAKQDAQQNQTKAFLPSASLQTTGAGASPTPAGASNNPAPNGAVQPKI